MPLIQTEGYTFNVPQEFADRGEFMAIVATVGGNYARYIVFDRLTGTWAIRWEIGDIRMNPNPNDLYGDGLYPPEFHGWEVVEDPHLGKRGDVYVCVDQAQREFRRANTPSVCIGYGEAYSVDPANGDTKPSAGWRIYRRKKYIGAVRLMPSGSFSEPLPLP